MNTKSKKILLILGLMVMCLAVTITVSAAHQYTDSECKEIATEYAQSHGYYGSLEQIFNSSSYVGFAINEYGTNSNTTCTFYVNRDSGDVSTSVFYKNSIYKNSEDIYTNFFE